MSQIYFNQFTWASWIESSSVELHLFVPHLYEPYLFEEISLELQFFLSHTHMIYPHSRFGVCDKIIFFHIIKYYWLLWVWLIWLGVAQINLAQLSWLIWTGSNRFGSCELSSNDQVTVFSLSSKTYLKNCWHCCFNSHILYWHCITAYSLQVKLKHVYKL